jgi:hypothetical protein
MGKGFDPVFVFDGIGNLDGIGFTAPGGAVGDTDEIGAEHRKGINGREDPVKGGSGFGGKYFQGDDGFLFI